MLYYKMYLYFKTWFLDIFFLFFKKIINFSEKMVTVQSTVDTGHEVKKIAKKFFLIIID